MKVLAIYRHYWPDTTPYARILRCILEDLAAAGHTVSVFTAQPSYNDIERTRRPKRESVGNVHVHRIGLLPEKKRWTAVRLVNYLIFLGRAIFYSLFHRHDVILGNSYPPVAMGLTLRWIGKITRAPYIYHCQDLHPESAQIGGKLSSPLLFRFLQSIDRRTCEDAARLVVLSTDMQAAMKARGVVTSRLAVINNLSLDAPSGRPAKAPDVLCRADYFNLLFAGNIGAFQGLEQVIEAAHILREHSDIQFVFLGEGERKSKLQFQAGDLLGQSVHFLPYQPLEVAFAAMQHAHLGIVSLLPGVYRVAYPSKTMMYLAAGCPVLGLLESHSELARMLTRESLGFVPDGDSADSIASEILRARQAMAHFDESSRRHIREIGCARFGREQFLAKWSELMESLDASRGAAFPAEGKTGRSIRRAA